jgi:hypothetical protein
MPQKKVRNAVPVVLIVLALLACVPVVSAVVASASGIGTVAGGAKTSGFVTVTSCGTRWLVVPQCRGTFTYTDGSGTTGAQPSTDVADVPLANDIRLHHVGARVAAKLDTGSGQAYVSGVLPILIDVIAILVLLFVLAATYATLSRVARRHQVVLPGPILTFVLAAGLAALLLVPFGDHTAPASTAPASGPPPVATP